MRAMSVSLDCFLFALLSVMNIILIHHHQTSLGLVLGQNVSDKLALLAIKDRLIRDPFGVMRSWNESLHFCMWQGVSCGHRHQRVTQLNLTSLQLVGYIPSSIGNLTFLRVVDLSNNSFTGEVPHEIGHLFRLREIILANNSLSGQMPTSFSNCSNLRKLDLSRNKFTGKLPSELGFLSKLEILRVFENDLNGSIPPHIGNISSLLILSMSSNKLEGDVPESLGQLKSLIILSVGSNMLSGTIPQAIYNLSYLSTLSLCDNQFEGSFPRNIGLTLPNIEFFIVWENQFSGLIPITFSNASKLTVFDISYNKFSGGVPSIFGNQDKLWAIVMAYNGLGSGGTNDLNFLTRLTNCSNLKILDLANCSFGGVFPNSVGNLSDILYFLQIAANPISGKIPDGIGNLVSLTMLILADNLLEGTIPESIGKLYKLQKVHLGRNELGGGIPFSFGNLTLLNDLLLDRNNLQGSIPSSIGNCKNLLLLDLHANFLDGTIPLDVIALSSLSISLDLSRNLLTGSLPSEVDNLKNLAELDISYNQLSGGIPSSLGDCSSVIRLRMDHNIFEGTIPETLCFLKGIEELDLSHNNLSGHIPKDLAKLVFLSKLNLSFNHLEGELPTGGVFSNISAISVAGNDKVCGGIPELKLAACSMEKSKKWNLSHSGKLIISVVLGLFGLLLVLSLIVVYWLRKDKNMSSKSSWMESLLNISYGELLKATNGFSLDNLIGSGSFGSVYKGSSEPHQTSMAVKVFNLEKRGASKSFMAECEALKNIRHRNLVKIITACSSVDYQGDEFKALVYELMPNGSLESWLHPDRQNENQPEKNLSLSQRLNMVIEVASALDYLHNHIETPITHCDLKPSNVLLDEDMTAHVGDFGLSRILAEDDNHTSQNITSSVGIKGTIGYAAPEYGMGSKVSTEGDVYSFGILLLEMLTGKRPTDDDFDDTMSLNQFVEMALPGRVMEIVDHRLVTGGGEEEATSSSNTLRQTRRGKIQHQCIISMFRIGVMCSKESPSERIKIKDALKELLAIKNMLLKDGKQRN